MSRSVDIGEDVFEGGPLLRWERSLGFIKPVGAQVGRRILIAVAIGWLPLAVLAAVELLISSDASAKSFFYDFAVHARFLIAIPVLIFAESECVPRLGNIVKHFVETGLIIESDKTRFGAAVSSTRRMLNSPISVAVIVVLAYGAVATVAYYSSTDLLPAWRRPGAAAVPWRSLPGWWNVLVSLPLFLIILLGWLWRIALWARFLFLMSRLDLRLIPGHPDGAGGLKFIALSIRGFRLVSFALGAVVAGSLMNRQMQQALDLAEFRNLAIGLIVFLLLVIAGPLTIFLRKLRRTKMQGFFEYGGLARAIGIQFEEKWLRPPSKVDWTSLGVQDFSATTDLYSVADNAYAIRELPFGVKDLIGPIVISALLPFLPLALMAVPIEEVLRRLVQVLF